MTATIKSEADSDSLGATSIVTVDILNIECNAGKELTRGDVAIFEASFEISEPIFDPKLSLLFYNIENELVFDSKNAASIIDIARTTPLSSVVKGRHCASFYLIANLPNGEYFAKFLIMGTDAGGTAIGSENTMPFKFKVTSTDGHGMTPTPNQPVILSLEAVQAIPTAKPLAAHVVCDEAVKSEARLLVNKLSLKLLGATPGINEIDRLADKFIHNNADIDVILDSLISDDRAWPESMKNNAGYIYSSIYAALLNRKPDFEVAGFKKDVNLPKLLSAVINSKEFNNLQGLKTRFRDFHILGRSSDENCRLQIQGNCIFVHTPFSGLFLYCALACCRFIKLEYTNKKIYLISDLDLQSEISESDFSSLCIDGLYQTKDILLAEISLSLNPGLIVSHSEGEMDNPVNLIKLYPQALFGVWSDGLRNATETIRWMSYAKVQKIYYFGFKHYLAADEFVIEMIVPLDFIWHSQRILLNKKWNLSFDRKTCNYAVFYPRYWWKYPYELTNEFIISNWVDTVVQCSPENELIVIKSSPIYNDDNGVVAGFYDQMISLGRPVVYAEEFLESIGLDKHMANLPSEDLYSLGIFIDSSRHYVLDSSLANIVASHPLIEKPCQIVLGGKMNINDSSYCPAIVNNLSGQIEGLMKLTPYSLINYSDVEAGNFPAIIQIN